MVTFVEATMESVPSDAVTVQEILSIGLKEPSNVIVSIVSPVDHS